jgi:hypothetical protein
MMMMMMMIVYKLHAEPWMMVTSHMLSACSLLADRPSGSNEHPVIITPESVWPGTVRVGR